jgi:hypothetical protein
VLWSRTKSQKVNPDIGKNQIHHRIGTTTDEIQEVSFQPCDGEMRLRTTLRNDAVVTAQKAPRAKMTERTVRARITISSQTDQLCT